MPAVNVCCRALVAVFLCLLLPAASAQQAGSPLLRPGWLAGGVAQSLPKAAAADLARLARATNDLAPQRPGVVDAYVLSVGAWDEHVFDNEATGGAAVLAERFGAQNRTVVLTNGEGPDRPRVRPSASPQNIAAALGAIGAAMDPREDALILFITSHGRQDGSIALREQGRNDLSIRPEELRAALHDIGVERALVILSACYSGAFIPALQDDGIIVVTAASYNRTSFGCEPQRDWTFFGDAFLNRALRRNNLSLGQAFEAARLEIASWEQRDNLRPSYPTIVAGAKAAPVFDALSVR